MSNLKRCKNCQFFVLGAEDVIGQCRRYPAFTESHSEVWCGEFVAQPRLKDKEENIRMLGYYIKMNTHHKSQYNRWRKIAEKYKAKLKTATADNAPEKKRNMP